MLEELDLVQEDDQITHLLSLDDEFDTEETLSESFGVIFATSQTAHSFSRTHTHTHTHTHTQMYFIMILTS